MEEDHFLKNGSPTCHVDGEEGHFLKNSRCKESGLPGFYAFGNKNSKLKTKKLHGYRKLNEYSIHKTNFGYTKSFYEPNFKRIHLNSVPF